MMVFKVILLILISNLILINCVPLPTMEDEHINQRERFLMAVMRIPNKACSGRFHSRTGMCMPRHECTRLGGNYLGPCAIFGACCSVSSTCSGYTSSKVSYFESSPSPSQTLKNCNYQINLISKDVCQIRLDFEDFQLMPPTISDTNIYYQCLDQYLEIRPTITPIKIPRFCGNNIGQHVYIPITKYMSEISLIIVTDSTNPTTTAGTWRIKVTQLECNITHHSIDIAAPIGSLSTLQNTIHHVKPVEFPPLAPFGCLQYYPQPSGKFRSFNFEDNQYIGDLYYAICFRREVDDCGISFRAAGDFSLGGSETGKCPLDRLNIQEGMVEGTRVLKNRYCDSPFGPVVSIAPGQYQVIFRSGLVNDPHNQRGFHISYELLQDCSTYTIP